MPQSVRRRPQRHPGLPHEPFHDQMRPAAPQRLRLPGAKVEPALGPVRADQVFDVRREGVDPRAPSLEPRNRHGPARHIHCLRRQIAGFGMRLSEACNLPAKAVDVSRGTVTITGLKGGSTRVYPLPSDIKYLIRSYRPEGGFYFSSRQSEALGRGRAHLIVKGLMRKAGMPLWATAHTLRHSIAVASLEAGAQLVEVKELLRHIRIG